jgi:TonB family protein
VRWSPSGDHLILARPGAWWPRWVAGAVLAAVILGSITFLRGLRRAPVGEAQAARPTLTVQTRPAGASVWLDDAPMGASPIPNLDLALGRHTLVIDRAGYAPMRVTFETRNEAPAASFAVTLHAREASPSRPVGASVAVTRPGGSIDTVDADTGATSRSIRVTTRPDGWVPPRRVSGAPPQFPAAAALARQQGTVVVELTVAEDGTTTDPTVVESAGDVFDRAVLDAIRTWRFEPAVRKGAPVAVRWQVRQRFEL